MEVYALDENFDVITVGVPYINLQWNRKYYEAGDFMMEVPVEIYDTAWAYIGTVDRPEIGMVQQVQTEGDEEVTVTVSGFFCEKMLDDKVCFPRHIADVSKTETAVRNIFTKYKADLPIELGPANSPLLGDRTQSDFSDDQMGTKIYRILETRELSYRVQYDWDDSKLTFDVWQGVDRTGGTAMQTFSTAYGNIVGLDIDIDDSDYKNYAIIPVNADDNGKEQDVYYLDWSNGGYRKMIVYDKRNEKPDDGQSMADFKNGILQDVKESLLTHSVVEDVNVDIANDGEYMVDFDLGDKCNVILDNFGIDMETRIVEVYEVFKADEGHTVTVGLGNKRISNIRRAVSV